MAQTPGGHSLMLWVAAIRAEQKLASVSEEPCVVQVGGIQYGR